jgi:hypothetical protein
VWFFTDYPSAGDSDLRGWKEFQGFERFPLSLFSNYSRIDPALAEAKRGR